MMRDHGHYVGAEWCTDAEYCLLDNRAEWDSKSVWDTWPSRVWQEWEARR